MGIALTMAWRNLWRNPRRTWLTVSAIGFVTVLMIFLITIQLGSYDMIIDSSLRIFTGQLQVQRAGYLDKPQIRNSVPDARGLADRLRALPAFETTGVAVRAFGFALASSGTRSYGVQVAGVEPRFEPRVSTIPKLIETGRYFDSIDAQEAVVGATLARNLKLKVGDELTLLGSARDGSVAATIVPVVGVFRSGVAEVDRHLVQLPLTTFQQVFGMGDAAHAIVFLAPNLEALPVIEREANARLPPNQNLVVLDWNRLVPGLKQLIQADWTTGWFMYVALILVVTFSILNTFIMSVLERTREFGIMLALGTAPVRIGVLVVLESALLAAVGLAVGLAIGVSVAFYFYLYGFTFPGMQELYGQYGLPGVLYPQLSFVSVALGPLVIFGFILLASLYPTLRIRRLNAVEAMHAI
ncbi:MAG TPA: FtsX-like permease family protein [Burkholderiales bacterium]|jgi:ABC-type lipoprotein release transport system permease subunit